MQKGAQPTYFRKPHIICQRDACGLRAVVWPPPAINYVDTDCASELKQLHDLHIVVSFDARIKRINSEQNLNLC